MYVSEDFRKDDRPRPEYIDRMNAAIIDAHKLGMSNLFIKTCLRHYIEYREYRELPKQGVCLLSNKIQRVYLMDGDSRNPQDIINIKRSHEQGTEALLEEPQL